MGRKKEFTGVWIPREVWEDDRLGIYDKAVYSVVSGLAKSAEGCFAKNIHIAEFCRFSERQVCKSISMLTKLGYFRVENAGSPIRRIFLGHPEPRTTCGVNHAQCAEYNAPCAELPRTTCGVTAHDMQSSDENLPIIFNYNNIYKNNNNNMPENKPGMEEIRGYIAEQKAAVDPVVFYKYYDAANWLDKKGNPINWRQKVLLWAADANRKKQENDAVPLAGSFETVNFFAASLAAAEPDDTADEDLPWVGG